MHLEKINFCFFKENSVIYNKPIRVAGGWKTEMSHCFVMFAFIPSGQLLFSFSLPPLLSFPPTQTPYKCHCQFKFSFSWFSPDATPNLGHMFNCVCRPPVCLPACACVFRAPLSTFLSVLFKAAVLLYQYWFWVMAGQLWIQRVDFFATLI